MPRAVGYTRPSKRARCHWIHSSEDSHSAKKRTPVVSGTVSCDYRELKRFTYFPRKLSLRCFITEKLNKHKNSSIFSGMPIYTYLIYKHYANLLWDNFRGTKSIYKNETYVGKYRIYLPNAFKLENPHVEVPGSAVAALSMWFTYDSVDGIQEIMRYCFLDSSGYRISDQSERPFNVCVDNWLNKIQSFYDETE